MGFIWRAKHGLSKHGILKTKFGLKLERTRREERRGEEEEEEEKMEEPRSSQQGMELWIFGIELTLGMNSCMNFHTIAWLLVVPKPRVC